MSDNSCQEIKKLPQIWLPKEEIAKLAVLQCFLKEQPLCGSFFILYVYFILLGISRASSIFDFYVYFLIFICFFDSYVHSLIFICIFTLIYICLFIY